MSFGLSPSNLNVTKYTGDQIADVPCVNHPRAPTTNDRHFPLFTLWRNSNKVATLPDAEGDMWYLAKFTPNGSLPPLAIWIKIASGSGGGGGPVLEFLPDSGTTPVTADVNGRVALNGVTGGGVTTIGGTHQVVFVMNSPYSLGNFEFSNQVGIHTTPSVSALVPLVMSRTLAGNYGPVVQNLSTADSTTAGMSYFNSADSLQVGMASTGFVSNPILQGNSFFQSTAGMVWSCVDSTDVMNWYIGGMQAMNLSNVGGNPILQIFNGYLDLDNQSKVNSFQNTSLTVPNGGSANVVIIGTGQHWQFFASTAPTTPDTTYRAAATVMSYDNGSNAVDNFVTQNLTFVTVGNQVSIANAGAATVDVMISGVRYL